MTSRWSSYIWHKIYVLSSLSSGVSVSLFMCVCMYLCVCVCVFVVWVVAVRATTQTQTSHVVQPDIVQSGVVGAESQTQTQLVCVYLCVCMLNCPSVSLSLYLCVYACTYVYVCVYSSSGLSPFVRQPRHRLVTSYSRTSCSQTYDKFYILKEIKWVHHNPPPYCTTVVLSRCLW